MKLDLIQCTVRLFDKTSGTHGNMEVVKAGPDAVTPPELLVIRSLHDVDDGMDAGTCSIANAFVAGDVERSKQEEFDRLVAKYGNVVRALFPGGRNMPLSLAACELPEGCEVARRPAPEPEPAEDVDNSPKAVGMRKRAMRVALGENGIKIPAGNLSEADLAALCDEHGINAFLDEVA